MIKIPDKYIMPVLVPVLLWLAVWFGVGMAYETNGIGFTRLFNP